MSTGMLAELVTLVEKSFPVDFIAIIVMGGLAKYIQHLIWRLI